MSDHRPARTTRRVGKWTAHCLLALLALLTGGCGDVQPDPMLGFPSAPPESISDLDAIFYEGVS